MNTKNNYALLQSHFSKMAAQLKNISVANEIFKRETDRISKQFNSNAEILNNSYGEILHKTTKYKHIDCQNDFDSLPSLQKKIPKIFSIIALFLLSSMIIMYLIVLITSLCNVLLEVAIIIIAIVLILSAYFIGGCFSYSLIKWIDSSPVKVSALKNILSITQSSTSTLFIAVVYIMRDEEPLAKLLVTSFMFIVFLMFSFFVSNIISKTKSNN